MYECKDCLLDKDCRKVKDIICDEFKKSVPVVLKELEEKSDITVLLAVESGSRAWGFSNKDSDYDIRFIFKYNSIRNYVRLSSMQDVIAFNDGLYDIVGWDISKALFLHYKNNPSLREWLLDDYIYIKTSDIFDGLPSFQLYPLLHHYFNMAKNNWNDYCEGRGDWIGSDEMSKIVKKYLYVLRCILTWNLLYESEDVDLPNINIIELVEQCKEGIISEELYRNILLFIRQCKTDEVILNYNVIEMVNDYVLSNLKTMKDKTNSKSDFVGKKDIRVYDEMFFNIVMGGE